jgi:hypothetical protein
MASRTRPPEEVRIDLPTDDDWILVKKHLTWGEARDTETRLYKSSGGVNLSMIGLTQVIAYLLDWSICDPSGTVIPVRRQSAEAIQAAFQGLDRDKGNEIVDAITAHEKAQIAALEDLKKTPVGALTP